MTTTTARRSNPTTEQIQAIKLGKPYMGATHAIVINGSIPENILEIAQANGARYFFTNIDWVITSKNGIITHCPASSLKEPIYKIPEYVPNGNPAAEPITGK